ncbi:hypothetical protein [Mesorhizobium sp. CN2-181]|uniref:hypothetical protein n=1 Tax=Mesorhizobium yinganensis TaxID=3157707 RepID=UPI0032B70331
MADEKQDRVQGKSGRAARLASELRANLARRKAQARSRGAEGKQPRSPEPESGVENRPAEADE